MHDIPVRIPAMAQSSTWSPAMKWMVPMSVASTPSAAKIATPPMLRSEFLAAGTPTLEVLQRPPGAACWP